MIISRTPYRISLFGGGSDYPEWNKISGKKGSVIGFAINKYSYISLRYSPPFFAKKYRISYSKTELVDNINKISHPAVRNILKHMKISKGLEIQHNGDLQARTGVGSSSSFSVGLINCIHALQNQKISKKKLASETIFIEQKIIKENVGSQDQIWASYGGFNRIDFINDKEFQVKNLIINNNRINKLLDSFILVFTGISRYSDKVAINIIQNLKSNADNISQMIDMAKEAEKILLSNKNIDEIGELLSYYWDIKKKLSDTITLDAIEKIYDTAIKAGAMGGKLLGAGSGGFLLLYVNKKNKQKVLEKLKKNIIIKVGVDNQGSIILDNTA